ncbi:MAG: A/G-specific adenine glycosylase [Candidatus Sigynarchaeota archaeon]
MPPQQQLFPDEVARFRARYKARGLTPDVIAAFQDIIKQHYATRGRKFPFREPAHYGDPYKVLVSEVMLQQTQADRVVEKYLAFVKAFPDFNALAAASNEAVLKAWVGLGYNRRALALKRIAEVIISTYGGKLPSSVEELDKFPSIGPNTAASIATFAFNTAIPFIETNIRTVFLHFFFDGNPSIKDDAILDIVAKTLDKMNPREWYYALMDYGVLLKKAGNNSIKLDAKNKNSTRFKGSDREVRGKILRSVLDSPKNLVEIAKDVAEAEARVSRLLALLEKEGFIAREGPRFIIKR